jgi:hypothetical protein
MTRIRIRIKTTGPTVLEDVYSEEEISALVTECQGKWAEDLEGFEVERPGKPVEYLDSSGVKSQS